MRRMLICLPLCLLMAPDSPPRGSAPAQPAQPAPVTRTATAHDDRADRERAIPDRAGMECLLATDPVAFLEAALHRQRRSAPPGYSLTLERQERIGGKLQPTEVLDVTYRAEPYSVRMEWKQGARRAQRILYVAGQNDGKVVARPAGFLVSLVLLRLEPEGPDVQDASRYPPTEFGLESTLLKTHAAWSAARQRGDLVVKLVGSRRVPELGDRLCWVVERTNYTRREEDGIRHATFFIDQETYAQVGTILRGEGDQLLGQYFFRSFAPLTQFDPAVFDPSSL